MAQPLSVFRGIRCAWTLGPKPCLAVLPGLWDEREQRGAPGACLTRVAGNGHSREEADEFPDTH